MSHSDLQSYESDHDQTAGSTVYTRFPVSSLPGRFAQLLLLGSGGLLLGCGVFGGLLTSGLIDATGAAGKGLSQVLELGFTPGLCTTAGMLLLGLGAVARSAIATGRNLLGEIVDLPDPTPSLEELDVQQQKLHVNLVSVQSAVERAVQTSFHALREQLLAVESRVYNVETSVGGHEKSGEEKEREEALWRFAASLDTFSGRLETKLEKRLEQFEMGLSEELAETAKTIAESIIGHVKEHDAQRRVEADKARAARAAREAAQRSAEAELARQTGVAQQPAAAAPTMPEIDSLGVFDELDDEGLPVPPPATPQQAAQPAAQPSPQQAAPATAPGPAAPMPHAAANGPLTAPTPAQPTAPPSGPTPGQTPTAQAPQQMAPGQAPEPPQAFAETPPTNAGAVPPAAGAGLELALDQPTAPVPQPPSAAPDPAAEAEQREPLTLVDEKLPSAEPRTLAPDAAGQPPAALPDPQQQTTEPSGLDIFNPYDDFNPPAETGGPGTPLA